MQLLGQTLEPQELIRVDQFGVEEVGFDMNYDILFTYLLHPGTAIYVGYNTNLQNLDPALCSRLASSTQCDPNGNGLLRSPNRMINDGRLFFVKISYLFRR